MGAIHEFLYDHKAVGILVFLLGAAYAGFVYFRCYEQWVTGKRRSARQARRRRGTPGTGRKPASSSTGTGTGRVVRPPDGDGGRQEDLLSRLAREEQREAESGDDEAEDRPRDENDADAPVGAAATVRSTRNNLQADPANRSTHILKRGAAEQDKGERTPLQNAIRAAVEESLGQGDSGPQPASTAEADETGQDSALTRRMVKTPGEDDADVEEAADSAADPATQPDDEAPAPRRRSTASHTEILRRAQRHEDLGLHREITADALQAGEVRRLSDADRRRRLSELGISIDAADDSEVDAPDRRLGTAQLDDILGRLDAALTDAPDDDEPPDSESATTGDQTTDTARPDAEPPTTDTTTPSTSIRDGETTSADDAASEDGERAVDQIPPGDDVDPAVAESPPPTTEDSVEADAAAGAVPDWARADTFDDEPGTDGDEPEQQRLF